MKRKIYTLLLIILSSFLLISCKDKDADLVATFYPHYDILNNIAKDKLKVSFIVPFGSEAHDFSPTPKDIEMINNSKLFVYASDILDVWVNELINTNINYINMSEEVNIEFKDDLGAVTHYWTDPFVFMEMIDILKNEVIKIDPNNLSFYENNAHEYKEKILNIHDELTLFLNESSVDKTLYYVGHNALGGFSYRYNITINSLIDHFSPEAEQTIKQILNLINSVKSTNAKYLFTEELIEPRVANTIKLELAKQKLDITILELHGYHNITLDEAKRGVTYADLFQRNVENIKKALN